MGPECIVVNLRAKFAEATYASEIDQVTHTLEWEISERFPLVKFIYVKAAVQNNVLPQGIQLLGHEMSLAERAS